MAFFFGDSFDLYAQPADAIAGYWDAASLNPNSSGLVLGRFAGSRAISWSNSTTFVKTSSQNDAVHHFVVAFMTTNNTGNSLGFYCELFDGATSQCSVVFRNDGAILLTSGGPNSGNTLATYVGATYVVNVWYAFEIEVVVHSTAGSFTVRKNGNPNNDFSLGSLNTRASANNYANKLQIGSVSVAVHNIDDFLWRSDASSVPWLGDIRCYTRHPTSDVAVQFSRTTAAVNALMWNPVGIGNGFVNAYYIQFTSAYSGLLTGVTFASSGGGTGHTKAAIFSNISNTVGSVLAVSAELTNPGSAAITFTFSTPAYVVAGQVYWIGFHQDASINYNVINSSSITPVPNVIALSTTPYASWPIANPGGVSSTYNIPGMTLIFTPQSNSDAVGELQQDLTVNYVYSSTNGQNDLYAIGSIGATPLQIVGVVTRGFFEKSDSGTRNATVQLKSGSTTVQGPNTALTTTVWNWIARTDLTDPVTGAAWTVSAVNNVQIGPVVTA